MKPVILLSAALSFFLSVMPASAQETTKFPKGRGFKVGETLPDIPLYDMDGKEVCFSKYLGKQYILYCWASW